MRLSRRLCGVACARLAVLVCCLGLGSVALAAPPVGKRIDALNAKGIAAYDAGDAEAAKGLLLDAVVLGKMHNQGSHPALVKSYVYLGLATLEGAKDVEKAERYFGLALQIDRKATPPSGASQEVRKLWDRARTQLASAPAPDNAEAALDGAETNKILKGVAQARQEAQQAALEKQRQEREEQDKILRELAQAREREARARADEAQADNKKLHDELRVAGEREKTERLSREKLEAERLQLIAERDQLRKDKLALEKTLAEANTRERDKDRKAEDERRRLGNERAQLERRLIDEKLALERQLRAEKQALEKQLGSEKQALQKQLAAEKDAASKTLAAAETREKNERAAKEKLEGERRAAFTRVEEDKARAAAAQAARDKRALGPPLPGSFKERIHCAVPDESAPGDDVFVHCAVKAQLAHDDLTLHYRPSGSSRFHAIAMERARSGWHVGMIPAALIKGSMLQYYVEASNGRGRTASNGKPAFPNVLMVNRWPKTPVAAR